MFRPLTITGKDCCCVQLDLVENVRVPQSGIGSMHINQMIPLLLAVRVILTGETNAFCPSKAERGYLMRSEWSLGRTACVEH